jgi:hypothetical protein
MSADYMDVTGANSYQHHDCREAASILARVADRWREFVIMHSAMHQSASSN